MTTSRSRTVVWAALGIAVPLIGCVTEEHGADLTSLAGFEDEPHCQAGAHWEVAASSAILGFDEFEMRQIEKADKESSYFVDDHSTFKWGSFGKTIVWSDSPDDMDDNDDTATIEFTQNALFEEKSVELYVNSHQRVISAEARLSVYDYDSPFTESALARFHFGISCFPTFEPRHGKAVNIVNFGDGKPHQATLPHTDDGTGKKSLTITLTYRKPFGG